MLVCVKKQGNVKREAIRYINRLSDLMFMLARHANNELGIKEQQPIYKYMAKT